MSDDATTTDDGSHADLAAQLRSSIARLCSDVEARSDPVLGEITHALELILRLTAHTHDHARSHGERLSALERGA